jgi:hypothetical protein
MAITKTHVQVQWDGTDATDSVPANSAITSEIVTLDDACVDAVITIKADNSTTPAADDIIYFSILPTSGDPDAEADSADEYDTTGHADVICTLDTNAEDPAIKTVNISNYIASKSFKLYADGSVAGSTNAVTVSAQVYCHLAE